MISQTMILTARTTEQTSIQADMQSHARIALGEWEEQSSAALCHPDDLTPGWLAAGTVFTTGSRMRARRSSGRASIRGRRAYHVEGREYRFDCIIGAGGLGDGALGL